jgi:type II secretory pathway predicted ATPase ExeA
MINEFLSFFNLSSDPFSKEVKTESLLHLETIDSALKILLLLCEMRGIGILCGKSGTGKSCLVRRLASALPEGLYKSFYICHSSVPVGEFYTHIADAFGIVPKGRRSSLFRQIKERISSFHLSQKIHPILIVDEAHLLSNDILKELRMLSNFEIDSEDRLTLILCGHEELLLKFELSLLESFVNSIKFTVTLGALKQEESFAYIESRVASSGNSKPLFSQQALALIHQASGGIIRSINTIASASLMKAFTLKHASVEADHVRMVIQR